MQVQKFLLVFYKEQLFVSSVIVADREIIVGRSYDCNVRLVDSMVSRRHARFWVQDGNLYVEDLNSRNGTFVNGESVTQSQLKVGDKLSIGTHTVIVEDSEEQETLIDTSSLITFEEASHIYEDATRREGKGYLPLLYQAAQLMNTTLDVPSMLNAVLKLVVDSLSVRRGFILTLNPETHETRIVAAFPEEECKVCPPLSRTLLRSVFEEKSSVLTVNALEDKRFKASESVVDHGIHSAMCVPLCGRVNIVGALYVDSGKDTVIFSNEDLELLTALGRVVGVAVENAYLHQKQMQNERLMAIGQATAGIGHCVKGLLVGLRGGTEFIEKGIHESDWVWVEKGWDLVRRVSDRIEDLVMNLLTFSRDPKPMFGPVNLVKIVEECFSIVRNRAEKRNITLELKTIGEVKEAIAGDREIFRILMNLINNALDACEEKGGIVRVTIRSSKDGFYLEVEDSGDGIPPEIAEKIFQAFVTTKGSRGTGLGLACCKRLVEAHHGDIWVESIPGRGTTFTVFIPADPTMPPSKPVQRNTLLLL